jgi:hypothetical protein
MRPRIPRSTLPFLVALLAAVLLAACEGSRGPIGPAGPQGPAGLDGTNATSAIVAFGSVDAFSDPQNPSVTSFGPGDVVVSVTNTGVGRHTVTLDGEFSGDQPVLFVSGAEATTPSPNVHVTGDLLSWTTTAITFNVSIWSSQAAAYVDDVFSFVLLVQAT